MKFETSTGSDMSIIVLSLEVSKTWSFYYIPHSQSQRAAIVVQSCKNVIVDSVLCKILVEWVHKTDITRIPKISQTLKKVHFQQGHQCYFASTKINQILNSMTQQEFLFSIIEVGSSWHRYDHCQSGWSGGYSGTEKGATQDVYYHMLCTSGFPLWVEILQY